MQPKTGQRALGTLVCALTLAAGAVPAAAQTPSIDGYTTAHSARELAVEHFRSAARTTASTSPSPAASS
jgi:hypothetical protein